MSVCFKKNDLAPVIAAGIACAAAGSTTRASARPGGMPGRMLFTFFSSVLSLMTFDTAKRASQTFPAGSFLPVTAWCSAVLQSFTRPFFMAIFFIFSPRLGLLSIRCHSSLLIPIKKPQSGHFVQAS